MSLPRHRIITALVGAASALTLGGLVISAPPADAAKSITGPDVASYQHPGGAAINWKKVARTGADFAIVKASEGTTYTNPYFPGDYGGAAAAGLVHGSYHFARPAEPIAKTALGQAKLFTKTVGAVDTKATLPPALDLEVTGGLGRVALIRWAQDFLLDVRQISGRTPLLYTYPSFWSSTLDDPAAFQRYPIWMASYTSTKPSGATLWQFTSSARVNGIAGNVDMSRYVGNSSEPWATISDGTVASPWPDAAPGPPQSVHASLNADQAAVVTWIPGDAGSSQITGYVVRSTDGTLVEREPAGASSATVSGLTPGTTYQFTVSAINSVGTGTPSAPSNTVQPLVDTTMTAVPPGTVTAGQPATIAATLTRSSNGKPIAGRSVVLERQFAGSTTWSQVATLTTDSKGRVSDVRNPHRNASWQFVFAASGPYDGAAAVTRTHVRPTLTATLDSTSAAAGDWVHLTGRLRPRTDNAVLTREVKVDGAWQRAQQKTITAGDYSFAFRAPATGPAKYRVLVAPAGGRNGAHSPRVTLQVTPSSS